MKVKPKFKYGDVVKYWNGDGFVYGEVSCCLMCVNDEGDPQPDYILRYDVGGIVVQEDKLELICKGGENEL